MKKDRNWYRRRFRHHYFSNKYGTWSVADLLWHFRKLPVTRISVRSIWTGFVVRGSHDFVERALRTDCRYPILVLRENNGKLHVMDGTHRVWKTRYHKRAEISARVVSLDALMNLS